jgi:hypothetical protein
MLRYHDVAHTPARLHALTSLEPEEFAALVPVFEACFLDRMQHYTIDGLPRLNRRSTPYKNSPLPTAEDQLLFSLVHMKQHLTQEVHGQLFGMVQSDAPTGLQLVRPVLLRALEQLDVVPARLATLVVAPTSPRSDAVAFCIMMAPNALSSGR